METEMQKVSHCFEANLVDGTRCEPEARKISITLLWLVTFRDRIDTQLLTEDIYANYPHRPSHW